MWVIITFHSKQEPMGHAKNCYKQKLHFTKCHNIFITTTIIIIITLNHSLPFPPSMFWILSFQHLITNHWWWKTSAISTVLFHHLILWSRKRALFQVKWQLCTSLIIMIFQNVAAAGCVHLLVVPVNGLLCNILMLYCSGVVLYTFILLQTGP